MTPRHRQPNRIRLSYSCSGFAEEVTNLISFQLDKGNANVPHYCRSCCLFREWHLVHCNPPLLDGREEVQPFKEQAPSLHSVEDDLKQNIAGKLSIHAIAILHRRVEERHRDFVGS